MYRLIDNHSNARKSTIRLWLALIGLLTSVVSAFYYLRIIVNMFMRERETAARTFTTPPLLVGITVAALVVLLQGIFSSPVLQLVPQALTLGMR